MQEPTHILAGVIIQKSTQAVLGRRWCGRVLRVVLNRRRKKMRGLIIQRCCGLALMAVLAFLSHGLLDRLANMTYHPPQADFHNSFWVVFHSCVLITTILFLWIWWRPYKWCVTFAMLPDLDWVFIHGGATFYRKPYMHNFLHIIFDETPPFSWLKVPNHRHNPSACLWEVGLILAMLAVIRFGRLVPAKTA